MAPAAKNPLNLGVGLPPSKAYQSLAAMHLTHLKQRYKDRFLPICMVCLGNPNFPQKVFLKHILQKFLLQVRYYTPEN